MTKLMNILFFTLLIYFFEFSICLPTVDPGVFVLQGVPTCRAGKGYCLLGKNCTVDRDFAADDLGGHCAELTKAFTSALSFVCCKYVNEKEVKVKEEEVYHTTFSTFTLMDDKFEALDKNPIEIYNGTQTEISEDEDPANLVDIIGIVTDTTGIIELITRPYQPRTSPTTPTVPMNATTTTPLTTSRSKATTTSQKTTPSTKVSTSTTPSTIPETIDTTPSSIDAATLPIDAAFLSKDTTPVPKDKTTLSIETTSVPQKATTTIPQEQEKPIEEELSLTTVVADSTTPKPASDSSEELLRVKSEIEQNEIDLGNRINSPLQSNNKRTSVGIAPQNELVILNLPDEIRNYLAETQMEKNDDDDVIESPPELSNYSTTPQSEEITTTTPQPLEEVTDTRHTQEIVTARAQTEDIITTTVLDDSDKATATAPTLEEDDTTVPSTAEDYSTTITTEENVTTALELLNSIATSTKKPSTQSYRPTSLKGSPLVPLYTTEGNQESVTTERGAIPTETFDSTATEVPETTTAFFNPLKPSLLLEVEDHKPNFVGNDLEEEIDEMIWPHSINLNACGLRGTNQKIGEEIEIASTYDWCWTAALMKIQEGTDKFECSGTLVEMNIVVTTAACLKRLQNKDLTQYRIVLGDSNLRDGMPYGVQFHDIEEIVTHPDYLTSGGAHANDIGIVRLRDLVTIDHNVCLACLSQTNAFIPSHTCVVSGYTLGDIPKDIRRDVEGFSPIEGILRESPVTLEKSTKCRYSVRKMAPNPLLVSNIDSFLCDVKRKSARSCVSTLDGGSPLVCEVGGRWYLSGITSWSGDCTSDPNVYTKVNAFSDWYLNTRLRMYGFITHQA